jgi:hypothetical protein
LHLSDRLRAEFDWNVHDEHARCDTSLSGNTAATSKRRARSPAELIKLPRQPYGLDSESDRDPVRRSEWSRAA